MLNKTYSHSNQPDENKLLIKCDRIELCCYNDYKNWVDHRYYKLYDNLNKNQNEEIETLYNNIRPTLCYFYENRNEIFIRYGLEFIDKCNVNNIFPHNESYLVFDKLESYLIEIDRVPFGYIKQIQINKKDFVLIIS